MKKKKLRHNISICTTTKKMNHFYYVKICTYDVMSYKLDLYNIYNFKYFNEITQIWHQLYFILKPTYNLANELVI